MVWMKLYFTDENGRDKINCMRYSHAYSLYTKRDGFTIFYAKQDPLSLSVYSLK